MISGKIIASYCVISLALGVGLIFASIAYDFRDERVGKLIKGLMVPPLALAGVGLSLLILASIWGA